MIETHPFLYFAPRNSRYLLLGSFPGQEAGDWFYGTKRTQFWSILENVYGIKLESTKSRQNLFIRLKLAISDVIYSCERKNGNNLDNNLINITYNKEIIAKILSKNKIRRIYFSSRFVENKYRIKFKDLILKYPKIELIILPSPSPRYAVMTKLEKIKKYKQSLPLL